MVEPKYKRGDLVWRQGVGYGIIAEAYNANLTDEEILVVFPSDRFIYSILWIDKDELRAGFREIEIDEMKERMANAQTG